MPPWEVVEVEVRAALGVAAVGVLAGEIATAAAPGAPAVLSVAAVVAVCAAAVFRHHRALVVHGVLALVALAIGALRMRAVTAPVFPAQHVARLALPRRTILAGTVVAPPIVRERGTVLVLEAERIEDGGGSQPACGRVRLTLRGGDAGWRYGDRLAVAATLRRPRNFDNPGGFDWVGHLARRDIHVTAASWDPSAIRRLGRSAGGLRVRLERWRTRLSARITRAVPGREGAVLRALVVGDEAGVDPALRDAFTRAGVVHVLSVSGLHITLVAAAGFLVARWLLSRSEWLLLHCDVARLAGVASLGPVAVYTALAGLGVATLRSAVMVAAAVGGSLLGRRVDVLRSLSLAALLLALLSPGAPLDIGFQLSFVSVLTIVCGMRRLSPEGGRARTWRAWMAQAALVSPCAVVGTAPLTAFHFHQVSLAAVLANPLTLPIFGSAVVIIGLVGAVLEPLVPTAASAAFALAGLVLRPGISVVRALGAPAWAALDVPIPTPLELGLLYAVLAGVALGPRRGVRVLVLLALSALLADAAWWTRERWARPTLRITFLDVGQGDAAVAELPGGRVLVVDAGGFPGSDFDIGAAVVAPFLFQRKILRLDALAMTHAHPDHSGGLPYLLAHQRPREFWWTGVPGAGDSWLRLAAAIAASGTHVRVLAAGAAGAAPDEALAVLHPPAAPGWRSLNDSSLTLRLGAPAGGVLLTGDIERRAEERLLLGPESLRAAVLKVPHHGSRTSSTPAFVAAVAPRVAVISVGADNRYRLPAPDVEARYRTLGACVLRTDRCGAITVEIDGSRLAVHAMRPACDCRP